MSVVVLLTLRFTYCKWATVSGIKDKATAVTFVFLEKKTYVKNYEH